MFINRYSRKIMLDVWSEENTFNLWLKIEKAVCVAWAETGIIPTDAANKIVRNAKFSIELYNKFFEETKHDLVSFTKAVSHSLGSESSWFHYGITSNDIKDTALAIQMVKSIEIISDEVVKLLNVLKSKAQQYRELSCIGRSHGMHAEPTSFGWKYAVWYSNFIDHLESLKALKEKLAICMCSGPVGSYATTSPDIEKRVAELLDLKPAQATTQVISRENHAKYLQVYALISSTIEKICVEIRSLQRTEIGEVEEPFGVPGYVSKGSSSMPHKKNPEISERLCGLARVMKSYSVVALENVALWHERDISHSSAERFTLPGASILLDYMLVTLCDLIDKLTVKTDQIGINIFVSYGLPFSSQVMLSLIEKGMPKQTAYDEVQKIAQHCWTKKVQLRDELEKSQEIINYLSKSELDELFDPKWYIRFVDSAMKNIGITEN